MAQIKNALELFKLLDKSNCKKCGELTCFAFAAAVFQGKRQLSECPQLDEVTLKEYGPQLTQFKNVDFQMVEAMDALKREIQSIDLQAAADRVGGTFADGKLTLKVMGKKFDIFPDGHLASDIHINPWLTIPLLTYLKDCEGAPLTGDWTAFRRLEGGAQREGVYGQRVEGPLKKVADTTTTLFRDIIEVFQGRRVENHYQSDISLIILPLPKVPVLICYWEPDDGLESDLNLFFDSSVERNLNVDVLYTLVAGLVNMIEKMSRTHGPENPN